MSLFYITGISGSGKSEVLKALQARGFEAHGTDEHGFGKWVHKQTGQVEQMPEDQPGFNIHEWFENHDWTLDAEKITELAKTANASHDNVFLCGAANGEDTVWDLFAKVFLLTIDVNTLKHRITTRTNNQFGKTPEEMQRILEWYENHEEAYKGFGAILVDATRPVPQVVDNILAKL